MNQSVLAVVSTIIGAVNLLVLLGISFRAGHWMGRVEARLEGLERRLAIAERGSDANG